jgi:hypothetical protein
MVLVSVMVLVEVGAGETVGVNVKVEVGVNVSVGLENVIFIRPQADTTMLNPNTSINEIYFLMFILAPASILHARILLKVTGRLWICLPAKMPGSHIGSIHSAGLNGSHIRPGHLPWNLGNSITLRGEIHNKPVFCSTPGCHPLDGEK